MGDINELKNGRERVPKVVETKGSENIKEQLQNLDVNMPIDEIMNAMMDGIDIDFHALAQEDKEKEKADDKKDDKKDKKEEDDENEPLRRRHLPVDYDEEEEEEVELEEDY